jgi:hypothetical protein
MNAKKTPKEIRQEQLRDIAQRAHLSKPNDLADAVQNLPVELTIAIASGRPELIGTATPRPLSADETKVVFHLVKVLMETNAALQEHANQLGNMATTWMGSIKGAVSFADDIAKFARFQHDQITQEHDHGDD